MQISFKNSLVQISFKLYSKPYDYLYKLYTNKKLRQYMFQRHLLLLS